MGIKNNNHQVFGLRLLLIILICGILSGIIGGVIYQKFAGSSPLINNVVVSRPIGQLFPSGGNIFDNPENYVQFKKSLVDIYIRKETVSNNVFAGIYQKKDRIGAGFVLTSDGWIVAKFSSPMPDLDSVNAAAYVNGKLVDVEKSVFDKYTQLYFLKLKAEHLSPVRFFTDDFYPGDRFVAIGRGKYVRDIVLADFANGKNHQDNRSIIVHTDRYSKNLIFPLLGDFYSVGDPVIDHQGKVAAVIVDIDTKNRYFSAVPVKYFEDILAEIFNDRIPQRVSLEIDYLNVSDMTGIPDLPSRGAYIYKLSGKIKYEGNSQTLAVGDIIVKVEQEFVDGKRDLNMILQDYKIGDSLKFTFIHQGKEQTSMISL